MKTLRPNPQPIMSRTRFVTVLIVATLAIALASATAYMQQPTAPQLSNPGMPVAMAPEGLFLDNAEKAAQLEAAAAAAKTEMVQDFGPAAPTTSVGATRRAEPNAPGTCDTAGPIEVESSGGTAAGVPTPYATLGAAFTAINAGVLHTGTITIDVCGDTNELTATATLNASGAGSTSYTSIAMSPAGGAARTITGATTAGSPMIDFNGADNVTINGLNTGGNTLTISNTTASATSGTSTFRFIGGATNNTITNSTVLGSANMALGTNGGTFFFSTDAVTTNGNDNNTISLCDIGPAGVNNPSKAIYGNGSTTTAAIRNSGVLIDNNNIFDVFSATVSVSSVHVLSGNDSWTISNNKIYQTAPRTVTAAVRYAGITLNSTTAGNQGAFTVTGNRVGFGAANGTGTTTITPSPTTLLNTFRGLDLISVSATTPTSVQGNVISGINLTTGATTGSTTSGFIAIMLGTTAGRFNVGDTTGNTIGSLDGSTTIVINATSTTAGSGTAKGIYDFSVSNNVISNNNMGAITINSGGTGTTVGFRGIQVNTGTANTVTISNNTIGGPAAAGSITDNIVGTYSMYAIENDLGTPTMTGNTIRNMAGNATQAGQIISSGIIDVASTSTAAHTISQNTIHSLSNNSGAGANSIYALYASEPAAGANLIERNFIHSLSLTSTAATSQIVGLLGVAGTGSYQNNMVRLGIDAAGSPINLDLQIYGIFEIAGTNNFSYNSSYVGGAPPVSTQTTFAFVSNVVTNARNYRDNIFWNARSNGSGAGKNYAIAVGGTGVNPAGLLSNYNDLFVSGTSGFVGLYGAADQLTLANWQAATGQDANSISVDPLFIAPTAPASTVNLHIQVTTPVQLSGTPIAGITNDFDGEPRPPARPDLGADQRTGPTAAPATVSGQITSTSGMPLAGVTMKLSGARSAKTITNSNGEYRFANLDTDNFYVVTPSRMNHHFSPGDRSFSLVANQTEAGFTATRDAVPTGNVIDSPDYFARQHYLDFLGREPDDAGFNFWSDQITACGGDAACIERRTINVSAAYFLSIEFQETGGLVDALYRLSYDRRPLYAEFMPDTAIIARDLVVGKAGWEETLEANKQAFVDAWVQRAAFQSAYGGLSNEAYVNTLVSHTGASFNGNRDALVSGLNGGSLTRAAVLRQVAENQGFVKAKRNSAFVMMQYFGYLRRDPDDNGFHFWLNKLNQFDGNFERAEMVKAFLVSGEYRDRFRE